MKVRFVHLILIHFILLWAFISSAADNFSRPMIFSGGWGNETRCRLVTIQALTEVQGKTFYQQGVGWVIQSESGYKILTPSHVIAGAEVIIAKCNNQSALLSVQSRTETKDLALLSPQEDISAWAFPLIALVDREKIISDLEPQNKAEVNLYHPDHFKQSLEENLYNQIYNFYVVPVDSNIQVFKTFERDLQSGGIAHFENKLNSLVAETLAIRPGFSGSPLLAQIPAKNLESKNTLINLIFPETFYQSYLLGMLTKVEVNGSRSLGISLPDIIKILPLLLQSHDSLQDVYVDALNLDLKLRYKLTFDGENLIRSQELLWARGTDKNIYSEICQDSTAESSEWDKSIDVSQRLVNLLQKYKETEKKYAKQDIKIEIKNEFTIKQKTNSFLRSFLQRSGGGDYGEGGGGMSLKKSLLMTPRNDGFILNGQLTSYKRLTSCKKTAVVDNKGRSFDFLLSEGKIQRVTSLSEAYDVFTGFNKTIGNNNRYQLHLNTENVTHYRDDQGQNYVYFRSEGLASQNLDSSDGELECITKSNLFKLQLKLKDLSLNVTLGDPQAPQGKITFDGNVGRCETTLSIKNYNMSNRWKHQIRSPEIDLDISIGAEGRILSVKVLNLAQQCQKDENKLWMYEVNFSEPSQIKKSFRPKSSLGFAAGKAL